MTGPRVTPSTAVTEPDPLEALKALRKRADPDDPLEALKALKAPRDTGPHGASREWGEEPGFRAGAERLARAAKNTARDVTNRARAAVHALPGGKAAEVGLSAIGPERTYRGEHERITKEAEQYRKENPSAARTMAVLGTAPLIPFLPVNPVTAGMVVGAADQALSADPDQSGAERAVRTVAGAGTGAALGKVADVGVSAARAVGGKAMAKLADMGLPIPERLVGRNTAANVLQRQKVQAATARHLYDRAISAGSQRPTTQAVRDFVADPEIAPIVEALQGTSRFRNVPAEDPRMLDAVYKVLSDQVTAAKKGLEVANPARPNIGRFRESNARDLQGQMLDAVEAPGAGTPAMMPEYRDAVTDFAKRARGIEAVERGSDALRASVRSNVPSARRAVRTSPESLREWAQTAPPSERQAAAEGVMGGVRDLGTVEAARPFGLPLLPVPSRAVRNAPGLMRDLSSKEQALIDRMIQLGLLGTSTVTP